MNRAAEVEVREILARNIDMLERIFQNEPESAQMAEKPSKSHQFGFFLDQNQGVEEMIAKMVVSFSEKLALYGIEAGLAGQMAKDLSRALWDRFLEGMRD